MRQDKSDHGLEDGQPSPGECQLSGEGFQLGKVCGVAGVIIDDVGM